MYRMWRLFINASLALSKLDQGSQWRNTPNS